MKRFGQKGPENGNRADALKLLEACDHSSQFAFSQLAAAGMPRAPKPHRAKSIEGALAAFDHARARLSHARYHFGRCKARLAERVEAHRDEPHDKAAVTLLEPMIESSTSHLASLRRLLIGYAGESLDRRKKCEERREADRVSSSFFGREDQARHQCNWCAVVENYATHHAMDCDGFVVRREKAVRFCCTACFCDGKDLREPAPKALPAALPLEREPVTETVNCVPVPQPQLPAAGLEDCHGPN